MVSEIKREPSETSDSLRYRQETPRGMGMLFRIAVIAGLLIVIAYGFFAYYQRHNVPVPGNQAMDTGVPPTPVQSASLVV